MVHDESRDNGAVYVFLRMRQGLLMSIPIVPVFQRAFKGKSIESHFLRDFKQYREFADIAFFLEEGGKHSMSVDLPASHVQCILIPLENEPGIKLGGNPGQSNGHI